jgi:tellurium resistance protein TerZ
MNLGQTMTIGAKWDKVEGKNVVDLDVTVVMIDEVGKVADACYYNKQRSDCNSVVHSGDQVTGDKEGFDETITINLPTINYTVSYLAILVSNAKGTGFSDSKTASISVF